MTDTNSEPGSPVIVSVRVDGEGEDAALQFGGPDGPLRIFQQPKLNQTPAQSAALLKTRVTTGNEIDFQDEAGIIRATLRFSDDGDATLSMFDAMGRLEWSAPIRAEHVVPDTPALLPKRTRRYRMIAGSFMLFLLVLTAPFILITPSAGPDFVVRASIGLIIAVMASIFVLQVFRGRHHL
ncbi:MAG: hypothetical protein P4L33_06675 [Capsulimonadaceae bacterium]|nr:hypothetical protein [Capsulimonadaceae bacterium]